MSIIYCDAHFLCTRVCSVFMERIGIRELRNNAAALVRRARSGERIVITVDGVPIAEIGPLSTAREARTLDDLVAAGLVRAPQIAGPPPPPQPVKAPPGPAVRSG
ncbi:MAG: type II toxin-antitoxin system Phd/YefM family antitoxin [Actinomycetota bacterium]